MSEINLQVDDVMPEFITPKVTIGGRIDKRLAVREVTDAVGKLLVIESDFIAMLFDENLYLDYNQIFARCNKLFYDIAKGMRLYKTISIDSHYFYNKYRPMV